MGKAAEKKAFVRFILAMAVFGSLGVFRRNLDLPSSVIACFRGIVGSLFLLLLKHLRREAPDRAGIRRNLMLLLISGAIIGFNWILLFESYNYTSVAVATLCYYMSPVIVMIASPFLLNEKMTVRKTVCIAAALTGMVFVSGLPETGIPGRGELKGILLGLGAACLYGTVVILNKKIIGVRAADKTIIQLAAAGGVLIPYVLLTESIPSVLSGMTPGKMALLFVMSIFLTGIPYEMYFAAFDYMPAQAVALFSYIDPVTAIILSAVILHEPLTLTEIAGAVMILGAAAASEISPSSGSFSRTASP